MSKKIEEILSENVALNESAKTAIAEAWNARITEAREQISAELREEFSRKFEHDKAVLAESMNSFLTDKIRTELEEFAIDRKELNEEKAAYRRKMTEHAETLDKFVTKKLSEEVRELRTDKKNLNENVKKLENFLLKQLSEEIAEFRKDRNELTAQKVKMVSEGKKIIQETKKEFITRAAKVINESVESTLRTEINQFRDDIRQSRENDFGRRMFEAFAAEFMTSHMNEGTEIRKLQKALEAQAQELNEARGQLTQGKKLTESLSTKLAATADLVQRNKMMSEMLAPLPSGKRAVMTSLLESVQTKSLVEAYNKYLPTVLDGSAKTEKKATVLAESKLEKTGDRAKGALNESDDVKSELTRMIYLSGIR